MLIIFLIALGVSLVVLQIMVFSTTIYLHRSATHRALTLHPVAAWLFRFFTWMTTGIVPREWVAVHRKHHAHTDEEGDPHSSETRRILEGPARERLLLHQREPKDPETIADVRQGHAGFRHVGSRSRSTTGASD